jgi:hypothetical protein
VVGLLPEKEFLKECEKCRVRIERLIAQINIEEDCEP